MVGVSRRHGPGRIREAGGRPVGAACRASQDGGGKRWHIASFNVSGMRHPPRHPSVGLRYAWHELIGGGEAMANAMLDARQEGDSYRRVEVITGERRRRRWTGEDKARIVAESFEEGANISDVARR